jgi:integrase
MKRRLTELVIEQTRPPATGRMEIFDTVLPSFGIRITATDTRSWFVMTRVAGTLRRITIGNAEVLPLAEARKRARAAIDAVGRGEVAANQLSFADYAGAYIRRADARLRPRSLIALRSYVARNLILCWGDRPLASINRRDVAQAIDQVADRGAIQTNRVLATVRKILNDAVADGHLEASPAVGIKPRGREVSRERALTDAEVELFWRATDGLGLPFGPLFKLMLLTAQREAHVAAMAWDEIDIADGIWRIAGAKMKVRRPHQVALSPLALAVIATMPRGGSRHVFTTIGRTPVSGFSEMKTRLDQAMTALAGTPVLPWHLHDLRRTVTHGLAQLGFPPHITDKIPAHSTGASQASGAVSNCYRYIDERRDALNAWGAKVAMLVGRGDCQSAGKRDPGSASLIIP